MTTPIITSVFPINNTTPVVANTSPTPLVTSTEFITAVNKIIKSIHNLTAGLSYETNKVLLQLEEPNQELKNAYSTYQAAVPNPSKLLLCAISTPLNIITRHLQDYRYHSATEMNLDPDLISEAVPKTH